MQKMHQVCMLRIHVYHIDLVRWDPTVKKDITYQNGIISWHEARECDPNYKDQCFPKPLDNVQYFISYSKYEDNINMATRCGMQLATPIARISNTLTAKFEPELKTKYIINVRAEGQNSSKIFLYNALVTDPSKSQRSNREWTWWLVAMSLGSALLCLCFIATCMWVILICRLWWKSSPFQKKV